MGYISDKSLTTEPTLNVYCTLKLVTATPSEDVTYKVVVKNTTLPAEDQYVYEDDWLTTDIPEDRRRYRQLEFYCYYYDDSE